MTICRSEQGRKVGLLNVCPDLLTVTRTGQQLLDEAVDLVVRYNDLAWSPARVVTAAVAECL